MGHQVCWQIRGSKQDHPKRLIQDLKKLQRVLGFLRFVAGIKIETGDLHTPDGTPYHGFKVSIGGITDPAAVLRTYDDIEKILHQNKVPYIEHEEHTPEGKFKSYSITT